MAGSEKITEIKGKLRLSMNGIASTSMREAGMGYKLNFGVTLPELRTIAQDSGKDPELAAALWKENIRECRILAALIYPEDQFQSDLADVWMESIEYPDLAEVCSMYLFSKMQGASETAFRWIASDNNMARYCGFLTIAHMLRKGGQMGPRYVNELRDQAAAVINGSDVLCAQAARTALGFLDSENG